jgi:hypothetical protein
MAGVSLALIGAGLGASFTDAGAVDETAEVGTFGIELSSLTPGAVVSADKHTVTFTTPMLLSSAAGEAALRFSVTATGSIPATIAITQSGLPQPFASLLADPVPEILLHLGESHVYDAGIAWTELGNGNLGQTASITYAVDAREGPPAAAVDVPTIVEKSCNANDGGITIPAAAGVDYFIDDVPAAAGFHQRIVGTYTVTAAAQPGYDPNLIGYPSGGWILQVVQQAQCVNFTLSATTQLMSPYGVAQSPPPVVDNVAHTITWTIPVATPSNPTYTPPLSSSQPNVPYTRYTVTGLPAGADLGIVASASVSPDLAAQASKFQLRYRSTVYGGPWSPVSNPASATLLPVMNFDLEGPTSLWDDAVGGHHALDNDLLVTWTGLTGGVTGTMTVTMAFTAQ